MDSYRSHVHQVSARVEFEASRGKDCKLAPDDIIVPADEEESLSLDGGRRKVNVWRDYDLQRLMRMR